MSRVVSVVLERDELFVVDTGAAVSVGDAVETEALLRPLLADSSVRGVGSRPLRVWRWVGDNSCEELALVCTSGPPVVDADGFVDECWSLISTDGVTYLQVGLRIDGWVS